MAEAGDFALVEDEVAEEADAEDAGAADPGVVMIVGEDAGLRCCRIEGHAPEVFVVVRAEHEDGFGCVV